MIRIADTELVSQKSFNAARQALNETA